jgi:simple sugar transport system ATP-binding protein
MAAQGQSIIFISHKLDEVLSIADRITVLRRGRVTAAGLDAADTNKAELAQLMVGRQVLFQVDKGKSQSGQPVLEVQGLHAENDKGLPALRGISFVVRAGEIYGIAGVAGNGQSELAQVVTGLRAALGGRALVNGRDVGTNRAHEVMREGVGHVPEDRAEVGSVPRLSVAENLILKSYREPPICVGWFLDWNAVRGRAAHLVAEYGIATPTVDTPVYTLSGGNLQRLILAREISAEPRLLVAVHPTRGLDVGATEAVHRLLVRQRERGAAILLISEDLDELLALSDRIGVLFEGNIVGEVEAEKADIREIGLMMAGTRVEIPSI